eukprot:comp19486_c0_seq1/m.22731 comp19486_c0_seq1/g.22731  ORF comp19486_c0_seq1/g.22731 comp19486_c0_seq1/m.22731 type:complete len:446 (-) comp19486_c0_seq1:115-1452(-)
MKSASSMKVKMKGQRNMPLAQQIIGDQVVKAKVKKAKPEKPEEKPAEFVDKKLSSRILRQAQEQQEEMDREMDGSEEDERPQPAPMTLGLGRTLKTQQQMDEEAEVSDLEEEEDESKEDEWIDEVEVDEADEHALAQFMAPEPARRFRLADLIMDRIKEKETEIATQMSERTVRETSIDPKVEAVYRSLGQLLSKYRCGKLPKAFKILPSLTNWEEILYISNPDGWSAAAMYQASRLFISNLNAKAAQRFFSLVLLPRVRDDIAEYRRLNVHLYNALKKALFKPQVFFKAILLPLAESGDCTLREATIVGSVVAKTSIAILHSSAALLKLAEMEYRGAISILIRTLIDKKYALPYRVVDALVHHFVRTTNDPREYPVLWHQSFLAFVQRYKEDITSEQKDALLLVLKKHVHPDITPHIRRELTESKSRDIEMSAPEPDFDMAMDD